MREKESFGREHSTIPGSTTTTSRSMEWRKPFECHRRHGAQSFSIVTTTQQATKSPEKPWTIGSQEVLERNLACTPRCCTLLLRESVALGRCVQHNTHSMRHSHDAIPIRTGHTHTHTHSSSAGVSLHYFMQIIISLFRYRITHFWFCTGLGRDSCFIIYPFRAFR